MKKISIILLTLVMIFSGCRSGKEISRQDLPAEIQTYLGRHFSDYEVIKVLRYQLDTTVFFDVDLNYGVNLEFNGATKEVIEIKSVSKLPDSVIAKKILDYMEAYYPSQVITGWKLDRPNQLIEVENSFVLEFNFENDFIRIGG